MYVHTNHDGIILISTWKNNNLENNYLENPEMKNKFNISTFSRLWSKFSYRNKLVQLNNIAAGGLFMV